MRDASRLPFIARRLCSVVLLLPVLAAAELPQPAEGPPAIGVLLPLSGTYQSFGDACLRGIQLAVGAAGGGFPAVRTVILDTRGDAGEALNAYRRLAADPGIVAVLGPMLSWEGAAVRNESAVAALPVVSFSQRAFPPGAPFFRFSMSKEDQAQTLAAYLVGEAQLRRWAILHPEDDFGRDVSLHFRDRVEQLGGEIRAVVPYDPRAKDFQKEVQRLQSRIGTRASEEDPLELHVDGVFVPSTAEKVPLIAPTLAFFDIRGIQLAGTNGWNDAEKLRAARPHVDGAVFVDGFFLYSFLPQVRAFVDAYRDAYGSNPSILEAYGYDAAALVLEEIRGGATDRARMVEHMYQPRVRAGATGYTARTATGALEKQLFLLTLRDGTIREIERPPPATPAEAAPPPAVRRPDVWRRPEWDSRRPEQDSWRPGGESRRPGVLGEEPPPILPQPPPQPRR